MKKSLLVILSIATFGVLVYAIQSPKATVINLDGSAYAYSVDQARIDIVNNYLTNDASYPITSVLKCFAALPINAAGTGVDLQTLKELLRRKAILLEGWNPTNGNGAISSPAPNGFDLTAFFGATVDGKSVPMTVVIPANFGGTIHGDPSLLQVTLNPEVNVTFMDPIEGYNVPSLGLYSISMTSSNVVYEAHEAGDINAIWRIQINLLPANSEKR